MPRVEKTFSQLNLGIINMLKGECSLSTLHGSQRFNSSTFSCSMAAGDDSLREYLGTLQSFGLAPTRVLVK